MKGSRGGAGWNECYSLGFFAFEAFLHVLHSWIVLFETPDFCIVTALRPLHADALPRLDQYWTHSHETNASRYLNVSKSSVLIYFSSFFMYALLYVFINFLQTRTNMYILCWFMANFKSGKENPPKQTIKMLQHSCCCSSFVR